MGSPVSILNLATAKQVLEVSKKTKFISAQKLNLPAHFVDYNKNPIKFLEVLKADIRFAVWQVRGATILITERRIR